ncbi:MAG TPA: hypothetical protein VMV71_04180 [Candidatus Paceibacterota bacterium]|nr:hypothetical protein [Candidatus Paceibacterota bacterium]
MPVFNSEKNTTEKAVKERALLEKLCRKSLSNQETFEAKQDLLGAFGWLLEMDKKYNPHLYENNRD